MVAEKGRTMYGALRHTPAIHLALLMSDCMVAVARGPLSQRLFSFEALKVLQNKTVK